MPTATLNDLADCLIHKGGLEGPHVRAVKRYLAERGILPPTSRKAPQMEAVHAAALLIACVAHEHQTHAAEALLRVWGLKETYSTNYREDPAGNLTHSAAQKSPDGLPSFGRQVCEFISKTAAWMGAGTPPMLCQHLMIWRGYPHAQIRDPDRVRDYRIHFQGYGLRFRHLDPPTDRISVIASIPWNTLLALSLLVAESRRLAVKQGVSIETASTLTALEPSLLTDTTEISEPADAGSENETAATLPGVAAALNQPAKRTGVVKHPHCTEESERLQPRSRSRRRCPPTDPEGVTAHVCQEGLDPPTSRVSSD